MLKLAAAIGNQFTLKLLSSLYENSLQVTVQTIVPAVEAGLIVPANNDYLHLIENESRFSFQHDKVQQACYELIDDVQKNKVHLNIGRQLLEQASNDKLSDKIFSIVNHINLGAHLVEDSNDKTNYAKLNLIAGKKAKNWSAYPQALGFLTQGIDLLNKNCWQQDYKITLGLYTHAADVAFLSSKYDLQEELAEAVINHATSPLDRLAIDEIKIASYIAQYRFSGVISQTLLALEMRGITFKKNPGKLSATLELIKCQRLLSRYTMQQLESLPTMTDQKLRGCLSILLRSDAAAHTLMPNLNVLLALRRIFLMIEHGNAPESAPSYAAWAIGLCGIMKKMDKGAEFGELALKLSEKPDAKQYRCRTQVQVYFFIYHWTRNIRDCIEPLRQSYHIGIETGDWEYATLAITAAFASSIYCGKNLELLIKDIANYDDSLNTMKQVRAGLGLKLFRQVAAKLSVPSDSPTVLTGDFYDEDKYMQQYRQNDDIAMELYFLNCKIFVCFLMGDYQQAETYIEKTNQNQNQKYMLGHYIGPFGVFYSILTLLVLAIHSDRKSAKKLLKRSMKLRKGIYTYLTFAPQNYAHKWGLILALTAQLKNKPMKAERHFSNAIELARKNEFLHEEAISTQLEAEFYQSLGREKNASLLMQEAYYLFDSWGAKSKCIQLQVQFADMLSRVSLSQNTASDLALNTTSTIHVDHATTHHTGTVSSGNNSLDLTSVMKASHAISGEIVLPRLIEKIMVVVLESTGAQKGVLIKMSDKGLFVCSLPDNTQQADGSDTTGTSVVYDIPLGDFEDVAHNVINFVARSKEMLVIKNAELDTQFGKEPYIVTNQVKSLLCYPLINQEKLTGLLYLENNLVEGTFTAQRIELLEMLSSQLAVSIDNAYLYTKLQGLVTELRTVNENLEDIVDEKTRDIKSILQAIQQGILAIDDDLGKVGESTLNTYKNCQVQRI